MPQVVPSFEIRDDSPSDMTEKPNNRIDEVGDEDEKETYKDEFFVDE